MLGIRGKGIHIAALSLGIDGVESKRAFAAAAEACDYRESAPWNIHIDILQIMSFRSPYFYEFLLRHMLCGFPYNVPNMVKITPPSISKSASDFLFSIFSLKINAPSTKLTMIELRRIMEITPNMASGCLSAKK